MEESEDADEVDDETSDDAKEIEDESAETTTEKYVPVIDNPIPNREFQNAFTISGISGDYNVTSTANDMIDAPVLPVITLYFLWFQPYYDENGLHFVFNEYDIDCYAAGDFDLCIEWPLPETAVSWKRGAGTHELPDDLYIPSKIAPLPYKEDLEQDEDGLPSLAKPVYIPGKIMDIRK